MMLLYQAIEVARATWEVLGRMAPYLLFGFAVAGLLHVLLPAAWVARHLGGRGGVAAVKAALCGVPLPLCSCSVIPVTAALRRHGAGKGATAAFLMSTPQTGVDSILVTWGLLGPVLAIFRPIAAFVSGALCGVLVDALDGRARLAPAVDGPANGFQPAAGPWWRRAFHHAFVTLPADIYRALLLGLLVAGLMGALIPENFFADQLGGGIGTMLVMLAIGVPLYVCSTASVPIALGLINAGVSVGAALVFLITGPATNAATLTALHRLLGLRAMAVFLIVLVATALASGLILDGVLVPRIPAAAAHCAVGAGLAPWQHVAAGLMLAVLLAPAVRALAGRGRQRSAEGSDGRCGGVKNEGGYAAE